MEEPGYEFQAMSGELDDVKDLMSLLGNCDLAISNAEQFMSQLGDKLSILDGVRENLYALSIHKSQPSSN